MALTESQTRDDSPAVRRRTVPHPSDDRAVRATRRGSRLELTHAGQRWWFELDEGARATLEDTTAAGVPAWVAVVLGELGVAEVET